MKKYIEKYRDWSKNFDWSKWLKWDYICAFIYSINMIVSIIREEYTLAGAYFITVMLSVVIMMKDKLLNSGKELIDNYEELTHKMLTLIDQMQVELNKTNKN